MFCCGLRVALSPSIERVILSTFLSSSFPFFLRHGVPPKMLALRNALEILNSVVEIVPINMVDDVTGRNGTMNILVNLPVKGNGWFLPLVVPPVIVSMLRPF